MNENIADLIDKAKDSLADAELLIHNDRRRGCVSRSYYAVFHITQALLLSKGIQSKTHTGLQHLFNEHFIKTKILNEQMQSLMMQLFQLRQTSDYDFENITFEEAQAAFQKAKQFISVSTDYLKKA